MIEVFAISKKGSTRGEELIWATDEDGCYVLCPLYDENERPVNWDQGVKKTDNQIKIASREEAFCNGLFTYALRVI
ncbi:MAG TPA: hypothetical protein VGQ99_03460 [Tepidisphaeraceae bacterium]|jgi:hypothetical protein|nr:hypothetical protein [Tepidisphaeraceae bacterium]